MLCLCVMPVDTKSAAMPGAGCGWMWLALAVLLVYATTPAMAVNCYHGYALCLPAAHGGREKDLLLASEPLPLSLPSISLFG